MDTQLIWTQGFVELFRWRRQHRLIVAQADQLVAETERFLAHVRDGHAPVERPHPDEPPRPG